MSNKEIVLDVGDQCVKINFEANLLIKRGNCQINIQNQELLTWKGPNFTLEIQLTSVNRAVLIINGQERLKMDFELDRSSNPIKLKLTRSALCLLINNAKKKACVNLNIIGKHRFKPHISEEIKLQGSKVFIDSIKKTIQPSKITCNEMRKNEKSIKSTTGSCKMPTVQREKGCESPVKRDGFCELNLGLEGCEPTDDKVRFYLTPEISYEVKNKNLDFYKKNNINNSYTNSFMASQLCISNPLHNLRAFIMDFVVKNLILFGLLVLFQNILSNVFTGTAKTITLTTTLIVAAIVVGAYNLVYWVFKALENIFVWACQYNKVSELVNDDDQWLN